MFNRKLFLSQKSLKLNLCSSTTTFLNLPPFTLYYFPTSLNFGQEINFTWDHKTSYPQLYSTKNIHLHSSLVPLSGGFRIWGSFFSRPFLQVNFLLQRKMIDENESYKWDWYLQIKGNIIYIIHLHIKAVYFNCSIFSKVYTTFILIMSRHIWDENTLSFLTMKLSMKCQVLFFYQV